MSLTGPDGLLKQLTKTVLGSALNEEMTEHLGHEKNGRAGPGSGNPTNRTAGNTVGETDPQSGWLRPGRCADLQCRACRAAG